MTFESAEFNLIIYCDYREPSKFSSLELSPQATEEGQLENLYQLQETIDDFFMQS